jgi:hypothetical protein
MKGIRVDPSVHSVTGRGRRTLARARSRNAGVRTRHHRRHSVKHRRRRAHAGRRTWLVDGQMRPCG